MTHEQILDLILHQHLPNGGWLDYWLRDAGRIGEFIRKNNLKPVSPAALPKLGGLITEKAVSQRTAVAARRVLDLNIRGGMRVPHLHYDDKIFMLNPRQWTSWSKGIIDEAKAKVAAVNKVDFGQAMNLVQTSEAVG